MQLIHIYTQKKTLEMVVKIRWGNANCQNTTRKWKNLCEVKLTPKRTVGWSSLRRQSNHSSEKEARNRNKHRKLHAVCWFVCLESLIASPSLTFAIFNWWQILMLHGSRLKTFNCMPWKRKTSRPLSDVSNLYYKHMTW